MATVDTAPSKFDSVKLLFALAVLGAGIFGFYHYQEQYLAVYRAVALVGITAFALVVVYQTSLGKSLWSYMQDSRIEMRKVVWPTRAETFQTTLIVSIMVVVVGVLLSLLDWGFGKAIQALLAL